MGKLSSKKLKAAHNLISGFHRDNISITFDVPSMLQYCLEADLRERLRQKKFTEPQINEIIFKSEFNVLPKKSGLNKVKFNFAYKDFESFQKSFLSCSQQV